MENQNRRVTLNDIEAAACGYFGVNRQSLQSPRRDRKVFYPRCVVIHFARQHTALSLPRLGERYHRDHTTILSAERKAAALVKTNEKFARDVRAEGEILGHTPGTFERLRGLAAFGVMGKASLPANAFQIQTELFEGV